MQPTTKTAQKLLMLRNIIVTTPVGQDIINLRIDEIISFKNELKEIIDSNLEISSIFNVLFEIDNLIQEIESVENND